MYMIFLCLSWELADSWDEFIHILQGYFTGIEWYYHPSASEVTLKDRGKINQKQDTTQFNKTYLLVYFYEWKFSVWFKYHLNFPLNWSNHKLSVFEVLAWCWTSNSPLPEPILIFFCWHVYTCIHIYIYTNLSPSHQHDETFDMEWIWYAYLWWKIDQWNQIKIKYSNWQ